MRVHPTISLLALAGLSTAAHAQFGWDPNCSTASASYTATANSVTATDGVSGWASGAFGGDLGLGYGSTSTLDDIGLITNDCTDRASQFTMLSVTGLGSNHVQIVLRVSASTYHMCVGEVCQPWFVFSRAALNATACFIVNNGAGPPVNIFYEYDAIPILDTQHESGAEDPVNILATKLDIAGGAAGVAGGDLNLDDTDIPPGDDWTSNPTSDANSFSFDPSSGNLIVDIGARVDATVTTNGPGQTPNCPIGWGADESAAGYFVVVSLSINNPPPPGSNPYVASAPTQPPADHTPQAFALEWGLDIGSDAELSDQLSPPNNIFDPGDMYAFSAFPAFGAFDGIRNDLPVVAPAPFFPEPGAGVPAPLCSFPLLADLPVTSMNFLDVDASDSLDFDLRGLVNPNAPLAAPINRYSFPTTAVHGANHLLISYDEDDASHYAYCSLPSGAATPQAPFGSTAERNELQAMHVLYAPTGAFPPIAGVVGAVSRAADERAVHPSLAPNPDRADPATYELNDDVDSLDAQWGAALADHWYFSVDAEAHSFDPFSGVNLDPGDVFLAVAVPPAPVRVVDNRLHLGLHDGVDLDAFEFVWLPNPAASAETLALIFSVDDNDPFTPEDESGGLDPAMLYASYLDGVSFPILPTPAQADIDAVTTWSRSLAPLPAPCIADLAPPFGALDFSDVIAFLTAFSNGDPAADLVPDGSFDFSDVIAFLNSFSAGCP